MGSKRNNRRELRVTNDELPGNGFTIIELVITTFIIGTMVTGLFGLFVLNLRAAQEAERRVVAIALANERSEMIRNLPYLNVGTVEAVGGEPAGTIPQVIVITRNGQPYTVRTDIRYIDDPFDNVVSSGEDSCGSPPCITICHVPPDNPENPVTLDLVPAAELDAHIAHGDTMGPCEGQEPPGDDLLDTDYKQVRIEVSWPSHNEIRPVLILTFVAPPGVEGGELGGTLDFQALNAAGQGVEGA
ncbi:type II secretion system protein, partial [Patescibacteria group bacterium]|nr:type II secretion system protein [Patescibacteria group bacterium]